MALEVLYDSLIHWLRIGCRVGWEEDQLDVVQLELWRVAGEVIETDQHSELSIPCMQHLLEKLHHHPCLLVLDQDLLVLEGTGSLGIADHQKRELLAAAHVCPNQKSDPLLFFPRALRRNTEFFMTHAF